MNKQTVLITGANKSIGFETARQLAQAGYHIFLGSRDRSNGEKAVAQLHSEGLQNIELVLLDVNDEASVQAAYETLQQRTPQLDVLINNAGISGGFPQHPSSVPDETIRQVYETNVFGPVRMNRIFLPLLQKSAVPRIVNVSSDLGSLTLQNDPNYAYYSIKGAAYGPSKTALNAYTVALAFELRDTPFKVNAVNPGYTATDFNQHRGYKKVEDATKIIVEYAMLDENGPTGTFVSDYGVTPW